MEGKPEARAWNPVHYQDSMELVHSAALLLSDLLTFQDFEVADMIAAHTLNPRMEDAQLDHWKQKWRGLNARILEWSFELGASNERAEAWIKEQRGAT